MYIQLYLNQKNLEDFADVRICTACLICDFEMRKTTRNGVRLSFYNSSYTQLFLYIRPQMAPPRQIYSTTQPDPSKPDDPTNLPRGSDSGASRRSCHHQYISAPAEPASDAAESASRMSIRPTRMPVRIPSCVVTAQADNRRG